VLLGYAPESGTRGDDRNDVVPHENRRTLRALKVFASWLALEGLGPSKTIDRYLGPPGEGHVVHFVAGLDEALGAANVVRATDPPPQGGDRLHSPLDARALSQSAADADAGRVEGDRRVHR
jgi:hypothetical protein